MERSGQREGRAGGARRPRWAPAPASWLGEAAARGEPAVHRVRGGRREPRGGERRRSRPLRAVRERGAGVGDRRGGRCCSALTPVPRCLTGAHHNPARALLRERAKLRASRHHHRPACANGASRPAGRSAATRATRPCGPLRISGPAEVCGQSEILGPLLCGTSAGWRLWPHSAAECGRRERKAAQSSLGWRWFSPWTFCPGRVRL